MAAAPTPPSPSRRRPGCLSSGTPLSSFSLTRARARVRLKKSRLAKAGGIAVGQAPDQIRSGRSTSPRGEALISSFGSLIPVLSIKKLG
jgi:hypothetical protein